MYRKNSGKKERKNRISEFIHIPENLINHAAKSAKICYMDVTGKNLQFTIGQMQFFVYNNNIE